MFIGSQARFSTDLDFTGIEEHDHEDIILEMMDAFGQPFHGIQFAIPDGSYYETRKPEVDFGPSVLAVEFWTRLPWVISDQP